MATMTTRSSAPSQTWTAEWTVAAAQFGYALLYAVCGYLALAHASSLTGVWSFSAPDESVGGGWGWSLVIGPILQLAPVVTGLGLLVTVLLLVLDRTRSNRVLTRTLLGAAAASLLTLVVSLTPAALSVTGWLLD